VISPASTSSGESLTSPVEPEQVDSLEFGIKSLWWDSRVKLNGAIFYYDYNDIQVFRLRNTAGGVPVNQLINAEDADILGIEFDIDVRPFEGIGPAIFDGFNVFTSFAWLDSSYTDFVNTIKSSPGGVPPVTVTTTIDFSGAQLVNSPEFSFVGYTQWALPTPYGTFTPRYDWSFKDDIYFGPENSELVGQKALWLMNFRLTYKAPSENVEISGWVENLTDQAYTVDVFNLARFRGSILYAIGDPRTYGVSMKVSF
jgi:iron complex outermembrane receptor protein